MHAKNTFCDATPCASSSIRSPTLGMEFLTTLGLMTQDGTRYGIPGTHLRLPMRTTGQIR